MPTPPARLARSVLAPVVLLSLLAPAIASAHHDGETDPIPPANRIMFADQSALIAIPTSAGGDGTLHDYPRSSTNSAALQLGELGRGALGATVMATAAGRIWDLEYDSVAIVSPVEENGRDTLRLVIGQLDPRQPGHQEVGTLPGHPVEGYFPPADSGMTSVGVFPEVEAFDVAVGDLDDVNQYDGDGRYDEIVVCYLSTDRTVRVAIAKKLRPPPAERRVLWTKGSEVDGSQVTLFDTLGIANAPAGVEPKALPSGSPVACGIGDVDGDGVGEIVVATIASPREVRVHVVRFLGLLDPVTTIATLVDRLPDAAPGGFPVGNVDVEIADFDGDGTDEIAYAGFIGDGSVAVPWVQIAHYAEDSARLVKDGKRFVLRPQDLSGFDFQSEGGVCQDGGAGLCAATTWLGEAIWEDCRSPDVSPPVTPTFDYEQMPRIELESGLFAYDPGAGLTFRHRQLALAHNSPDPVCIGHRNVANSRATGIQIALLGVEDDLERIVPFGYRGILPTCEPAISEPPSMGRNCRISQRFSLAAGNFTGAAEVTPTGVLSSLVLTTWEKQAGDAQQEVSGTFGIYRLDVDLSTTWSFFAGPGIPTESWTSRHPAVAWDPRGDSLYLGEPVHLTFTDIVRPRYIIQEPAKHTAWEPPNDPMGGITNVSRFNGFGTTLTTKESAEFSTNTSGTTSSTVGWSETSSMGFGTEGAGVSTTPAPGFDFGIGGSFSMSVTNQSGFQAMHSAGEWTGSTQPRSVSSRIAAATDDRVVYDQITVDIWRYRIFRDPEGPPVPEKPFFELMIPRSSIDAVDAGGLDLEWYQPPHENGNALSYPDFRLGEGLVPDAFGPYDIIDADGAPILDEAGDPLTDIREALLRSAGTTMGDATSITLDFSSETLAGNSFSFSSTLSDSETNKRAYSANVTLPLVGTLSGNMSTTTSLSESSSFAGLRTDRNTASEGLGIAYSTGIVTPNQRYQVAPMVYVDESGVLRVESGATFFSTNLEAWWGLYEGQPDPALNLPRRYKFTFASQVSDQIVLVNEYFTAKRIRGFQLLSGTPNDATGEYEPLYYKPALGDVVRFQARVHNYSLNTEATDVEVAFELESLLDDGWRRRGQRQEVERVTIPRISPRGYEMAEVEVHLSRANLVDLGILPSSPSESGCFNAQESCLNRFRIWVVVDPENDIRNEIYEGFGRDRLVAGTRRWEYDADNVESVRRFEPWQNNEGWALLDLAINLPLVPINGADARAAAFADAGFDLPLAESAPPADIHLLEDSIAVETADGLRSVGPVSVNLGDTVPVRVTVHTNASSREPHDVRVFVEDPEGERSLLRHATGHGVDAHGNSHLWIEWEPSSAGTHWIDASVIEKHLDGSVGNAEASIEVHVKGVRRSVRMRGGRLPVRR